MNPDPCLSLELRRKAPSEQSSPYNIDDTRFAEWLRRLGGRCRLYGRYLTTIALAPRALAALLIVGLLLGVLIWFKAVESGLAPSLNTPLRSVMQRRSASKAAVALGKGTPIDVPQASVGNPAPAQPQQPVPPIEPGVQRPQLMKLERSGIRTDSRTNVCENLDVLFDWASIWRSVATRAGTVVAAVGDARYSLHKDAAGNMEIVELATPLDGAVALRLDARDPELQLGHEALRALPGIDKASVHFVPERELGRQVRELTEQAMKSSRQRFTNGFTLTARLRWVNGLGYEILSATPRDGAPEPWNPRMSAGLANAGHVR